MQHRVVLPDGVRQGIEQIVRSQGAEVLEIVVRGNRREPVIEVFVDNETGVTIALCETISRAVMDLPEMEQLPGSYRLIVSSPGVDRPLQYLWQYRKHTGRMVLLELVGGEHRKGRIVSVGAKSVTIQNAQTRQEEEIAFEDIISGKIQIEFV